MIFFGGVYTREALLLLEYFYRIGLAGEDSSFLMCALKQGKTESYCSLKLA